MPSKFLVVDDDEAIRISIAHFLAEIGYDARSAEDGYSALRAIEQEMPDILLSDLDMPGMSGIELLAEVRQRFPAILVIAMSGSYSGREVPSGVAADGFYEKGCSVAALFKIIQALPHPVRTLPKHPVECSTRSVHRKGHESVGTYSAADARS